MEEKEVLIQLENHGCLKGKYIEFKQFKPFLITKTFLEKRDQDKVLVLRSGSKRFEYWINQNLFIPPWQTYWFQLNENILLKLEKNLLSDLISGAIKKSGNLYKLTKKLQMSPPTFYNFMNEKGIKMISIKKLKRLLAYLNINYAYVNKRIEYTKKGDRISIKKFVSPIDLANSEGAALLGMIVSDGCIYIDQKARNAIRTKYSSGEKESINKFIKTIGQLFGKVHIQKEWIRNCDILKIGSSIIGEILLKVGGILGHKAKVDGEVPWLITQGNSNLKKNYLRAVFEDEASIYVNRKGSYITLSRYKHLTNLTKKQKIDLQKLERFMNLRKFPTGHITKYITFKRALERLDRGTKTKLLKSTPKLLLDESILLKEFGINTRLHGSLFTLTPSRNHSVSWTMFISQKDSIVKFYKEIGFSLKDKQEKLIKCLGV